jgi:putative membrane protein
MTLSNRRVRMALTVLTAAGLTTASACTSATTTPKDVRSEPAATATAISTATATPTASSQDATYLRQAHQSNLAEIAAGQTAEQKGNSAAVRALGQRLVTDHTALDQSLRQVATRLGVSLPATPDARQQMLAQQYATATGEAFDRLFVSTQIDGHAQAMQAGNTELSRGTSDTVKLAARSAAPVMSAHAGLLKQAADALGIPDDMSSPSPGPSPSS